MVVLLRGLPRGKYILSEEALADKFFQVPLEASGAGGLVSLTVVVRAVIFHSGKCRVVLDRLQAPYSRLVLDGTEDFVDEDPQRGEVLFHFEGSE